MRAPSARPAPVIAASNFATRPTSRSRTTSGGATSRSMRWRATQTAALIDPHGGRVDLEARKLRHVSEAFNEDPVRILRVARFLARFQPLGFTIAPETVARMRAMVAAGEADALVPGTHLAGDRPRARRARARGLAAGAARLRRAGADLPGTRRALWRAAARKVAPGDRHRACTSSSCSRPRPTSLSEPRIRFAALMHDLGKGRTPRSKWPRHIGHEESSVQLVLDVSARLRVPVDYRELAVLAARWHGIAHRAEELRPRTILDLLESCDAFRRPERFRELLLAFEADSRGRGGLRQRPYPQAEILRGAQEKALAVTLVGQGPRGPVGRKDWRTAPAPPSRGAQTDRLISRGSGESAPAIANR